MMDDLKCDLQGKAVQHGRQAGTVERRGVTKRWHRAVVRLHQARLGLALARSLACFIQDGSEERKEGRRKKRKKEMK